MDLREKVASALKSSLGPRFPEINREDLGNAATAVIAVVSGNTRNDQFSESQRFTPYITPPRHCKKAATLIAYDPSGYPVYKCNVCLDRVFTNPASIEVKRAFEKSWVSQSTPPE